jgi:ApaG protein
MSDPRYRISISVRSQHLPEQSAPDDGTFSFAYTVTIRNDGEVPAQLISRYWHIEDEAGKVIEVRGLGVVGQQPLLAPGESFEYTSGSQIATPKGSMQGSYFFVAEDGHRFEAPIPMFLLAMPRTLH